MSLSRRDFLGAGAAAAAGLALPNVADALPRISVRDRAEDALQPAAGRPVIISATNGYNRDPSGKRGIEVAWDILSKGGDPLVPRGSRGPGVEPGGGAPVGGPVG